MESTQSSVDDITWHIYVGTLTTIVPATLAVILRFLARHVSDAGFWWDDYTIAMSLVVSWVIASLRWAQISMDYYGPDAHSLRADQVEGFGKMFIAIQLLYVLNAALTKTSLLLLYHRIFGVVRGFRWVLWVSGIFVGAWWMAGTLCIIFECWPIAKLWTPNLPGRCISIGAFGRWNGIANIVTEVLVLCLPYPMAWRLQTSVRQKLILTGIFLMGTFVCFVSIFRVISFDYDNLGDGTYKTIGPSTWSSIEQSVGIICACLPTMRPLFRWLSGSFKKDTIKRDSTLSIFPKQTILSCRAGPMDEENAWGLEEPPIQERIMDQSEHDRSFSQQTVETSVSVDLQHRPESFA
ncbi:hypothetical protein N7520_003951 [Penicillium odoratum]|uniref:uncharacterized protein n=1 Tax=Penicillium odoratum TaxID=1167516 RepID=UPI0025468AE0|nr:uncharacterized protein N7520_003951 [Penicillium odoratum]KAJ5769392.1 hypothetical protein N7520_003951 [Penicillium odoratum]